MNTLRRIVATAAALAMISPTFAQTGGFPERGKTLRLVVPFAAGGGVDNAARQLAEQLRKQLGLTVIVDNKAGASGTIGGNAVKTAPADGYTLLFSAATHVLARQVMTNAPYDPQADFAPVARVGEAPLMLVIAPQREQKNVSEVLAAARQQPEKWTAAIPAAGASAVVDRHWLLQRLGQVLPDHASQDVHAAAGRERDDDAQRPRRECVLRQGRGGSERRGQRTGKKCETRQKVATESQHGGPL